jgi:hypothetical protein
MRRGRRVKLLRRLWVPCWEHEKEKDRDPFDSIAIEY